MVVPYIIFIPVVITVGSRSSHIEEVLLKVKFAFSNIIQLLFIYININTFNFMKINGMEEVLILCLIGETNKQFCLVHNLIL